MGIDQASTPTMKTIKVDKIHKVTLFILGE